MQGQEQIREIKKIWVQYYIRKEMEVCATLRLGNIVKGNKLLKTEEEIKHGRCYREEETIEHLKSGSGVKTQRNPYGVTE